MSNHTVIDTTRFEIYGEVPADLWKTEKPFIAKLQKPLFGDPMILVYDKTNDWQFMMPYKNKHDDLIFNGEPKVYAKCWFMKDGQFHIDEIVDWQDW
jgi:hypothetical protein